MIKTFDRTTTQRKLQKQLTIPMIMTKRNGSDDNDKAQWFRQQQSTQNIDGNIVPPVKWSIKENVSKHLRTV